MARFLLILARSTALFLTSIWMLHCHVFLCPGCIWIVKTDDMTDSQSKRLHVVLSEILAYAIGPMTTPGVIVFIINDVANYYSEIQSWECAYILSGLTVGLVTIINLLWVDWHHGGEKEKNQLFWAKLLLPFGFKSSEHIETALFTLPLVSLAPAIVGGYIANFILERKYILQCDEQYNPISTICEDGVCCIMVSNHESWFNFVPKLGGSVVAAWGVVKFVGTFIITYGEFLDAEEDTDEDIKNDKETQSEDDVASGQTTTMRTNEDWAQ